MAECLPEGIDLEALAIKMEVVEQLVRGSSSGGPRESLELAAKGLYFTSG